MNLFETVKGSVTTLEAAKRYGLHVSHNGMCTCPFHSDKHPSMRVDGRYHCFGCQADGDVIDFTARLYNLSAKEAALKLADDFHIPADARHSTDIRPVKREPSEAEKMAAETNYCFSILANYRNMLSEWQIAYAPISEADVWHPRFVEASRNLAITEYLLDQMLTGTVEERKQIVSEQAKRLPILEKRVKAYQEHKLPSMLCALDQPPHSTKAQTRRNNKEASIWNL